MKIIYIQWCNPEGEDKYYYLPPPPEIGDLILQMLLRNHYIDLYFDLNFIFIKHRMQLKILEIMLIMNSHLYLKQPKLLVINVILIFGFQGFQVNNP